MCEIIDDKGRMVSDEWIGTKSMVELGYLNFFFSSTQKPQQRLTAVVSVTGC